MRSSELRELQAPLKERYRAEPQAALVTLRAEGRLGAETLTCKVDTGRALVEAGLHTETRGARVTAVDGGESVLWGTIRPQRRYAAPASPCSRSRLRSTSSCAAAQSAPRAISIFAAPS